jgi:hypothetical protein
MKIVPNHQLLQSRLVQTLTGRVVARMFPGTPGTGYVILAKPYVVSMLGDLPVTSKNGASSICFNCSKDLRTVETSSSGGRQPLLTGKCFAITATRL